MSDFLRTDVTAVKLVEKSIFAGIGSELNIYNRESFKLVQKVNALIGQKIYGIIPSKCQSKLLIYGGKQIALMHFDNHELNMKPRSIICDDWLHYGIWLNDEEVAVLTAHNVLQIWNIHTSSLKHKHEGKHNSILYSGLLLALNNDILVFSGTVYSEVIIQTVKGGDLHHLKGHKGVIFSIACDPAKRLIVTTSDDRSVRIWGMQHTSNIQNTTTLNYNTKDFWQNIKIDCVHELYGHTARVMRSHISDNCIISVGEDSGICFWGFDGRLLRRIISHQNSSIWCLDADDKHLVTGGGDCAIILHPLSLKDEYKDSEIINIDTDTPKRIEFTARKNVVFMNESNVLVYYDLISKNGTQYKLNHDSTYKMLSVSSCKQIIAVSDMNGNLDVFIEICKGESEIQRIISTKLNIDKILSMHWAGNRHLICCTQNGAVNVVAAKDESVEVLASYVLPQCKERWLTAAALTADNKILIVGDRCGNIHVFDRDVKNPVKTFNKVHGRYGATSINILKEEVITTGRDGSIKYFLLSNEDIKYMSCKNVDFQWVEKFIDKNYTYVCGFQERSFVVYNLNNNAKLMEVCCGGGHRSWDVLRFIEKENDSFEEVIKLIYVKNSDIHLNTFHMSRIVSTNVIHGIHSKAINCLRSIHTKNNFIRFLISGGEDTTLRISKLESDKSFQDVLIFKHLSNVRTVKTTSLDDNRLLLVSAGGRAQICAKILCYKGDHNIVSEDKIDFLIKGSDKERKGNQSWKSVSVDFDPETRVMDLEINRTYNGFNIFAACSDAYLRVFLLDDEYNFKLEKIIKHNTCILKVHSLKINDKDLLVTCTTRGEVSFWKIPDIVQVLSTKTNKSGINCISSAIISETRFVIATGGDDNALHVLLLEYHPTSIEVIDKCSSSKFHSSQITGLVFLDDMLISTSIDQRVTLLRWNICGDNLNCNFVSQTFSNVADIHGMDLLECDGHQASQNPKTFAHSEDMQIHCLHPDLHKLQETQQLHADIMERETPEALIQTCQRDSAVMQQQHEILNGCK